MKKYFFFLLFIISSSVLFAQKDTTLQTFSETSKLTVDSNILVVVDGSVLGTIRELKIDFNKKFPADIIASIDVLKGQRAIDKYGDKGKAGVIEFYLKNVQIIEKEDFADSVFRKVEIEASFSGGDKAWRIYLERNLNASVPADNKAPEGKYTVIVVFIVDKDGTISDIKAQTNHGYGMEQEVIKVISKGPKWTPAIQDGKPVKAFRKQPVTFQVISDEAFKLSTDTIFAGKPATIEILEMEYVKDEDIEVTVSAGTIIHDSGKIYIITADKPGKIFLTITKKAKKQKDQFKYGTVEIVVK